MFVNILMPWTRDLESQTNRFHSTNQGWRAFLKSLRVTRHLFNSRIKVPLYAAVAKKVGQRALQHYRGRQRSHLPPTPPPSPKKMRQRSRSRSSRRRSGRRHRRRSSRLRSSSIATRQNDDSLRYRPSGRSGPRRGTRRFNRRVTFALLRDQPLQIYTVKGAFNLTCAAQSQTTYGVGLYTTFQTDQPDLSNIFVDAGLNLATAANQSSRLHFRSACLDVQFKNTGATECIVDVYEILNVKDVNTQNDMGTQWSTFYGFLTSITASVFTDVAVSVFENPVFCQHYKVIKKQEVLILPSEIITMQMRDSKTHVIEGRTVQDYPGSIPKLGKFYFIMFHGPPDPTVNSGAGGTGTAQMTVAWQKAYKYQVAPTTKQTAGTHQV